MFLSMHSTVMPAFDPGLSVRSRYINIPPSAAECYGWRLDQPGGLRGCE